MCKTRAGLTWGTQSSSSESVGMIDFAMDDNGESLEISRKSAEEARLKFDGWMLTLAMLFSDAKRTGEN